MTERRAVFDERAYREEIARFAGAPPSGNGTPVRGWPAPPSPDAYHGLGGEIVHAIEPHSEADPVAILVQFLVAFGNAAGRTPYFGVESDQHHLNLFALLIGVTSKGRKGIALGHARRVLADAAPDWSAGHIVSGLSSGEGLIWHVRDPVVRRQQGESVLEDEGVNDKRLLVVESEFASVLKVVERDGNVLSPVVRQAWDTGTLRTLTKHAPAVATGAHISIIGHITADELQRRLDRTQVANGFLNRYVLVCVRRSKLLPEGGELDAVDFSALTARTATALAHARQVGGMHRDDAARDLWRAVYPRLSEGRPGLFGAITSRAEAQVVRLACVYALLDQSTLVREPHLRAALALWDYADRSAAHVFGDTLGDPVADAVMQVLEREPRGLTRTQLSDHFAGHQSKDALDRALGRLDELALVERHAEATGGRPAERWTRRTKPPEGPDAAARNAMRDGA